MKEIELTKNQITLVDDEDYEKLNQHKWYAKYVKYSSENKYYAARSVRLENGKQKTIFMHNVIMNTPKHMECDHVFHNTLDNRKFIEVNGEVKENLRNCNHNQNGKNTSACGKSKYLGVSFNKGKYIIAHIRINNKNKHLGTFKTEEDAAKAYDNAAIKYFGEFANLNFK